MSNLRWAIYRTAILAMMRDCNVEDITVGECIFYAMPDIERQPYLNAAAITEGSPDYFSK